MRFCDNCGLGNTEEASFCVQCGAPLATEPEAAAAIPVPEGDGAAAPGPAVPPPAGPWQPPAMLPPGHPPYLIVTAPKYVGFAIASMVLGIVSIWMYPLGFILGILGIVFWKTAVDRLAANPTMRGAGMATAGLVCGIIGIVVSLLFWIVVIIAIASGPGTGGASHAIL